MKVTNSLFLFANLFVSVSDMLVKYFLITVKLKVQEFSWMSEPLDGEEADMLEKMSEETFGHPMYAMPYLYMEGRIRKDGSVFLYVFSASGAMKHHEEDYAVG